MAIWGADVQQLRDLGKQLQSGATDIESQKSRLNQMLNTTDWKGPDAEKFRGEWDSNHMAQLTKVADALKDAGQRATKNADAQDQTSQQ
ncbi:uncharacterized protein YukE [Arthrobacter pascens]|uniref:WXG100 family type VII secretion target n=1 Tax=Arthrobacter pascens TaxID=1677 RepID=UPI0027941311|nr:WXG100 family type VII secretion target [Arthrobacter pascens]MDQ0680860.1 uncharacterized protein YukE [Arthrobacter pascens]